MRTFGRRQNRDAAEKTPASRPSIFARPAALTVGRPGDSQEQEADRVSELVVGKPPARNALANSTGPGVTQDSAADDDLLRSPGQPLDTSARAFMESRFQFDFGHVRVHRDQAAGRAASALSARAFTLGSHIAFGHEQYAPETPRGRKLLAHELTHVVQYAQDPSPVVRRAPTLKGHSNEEFGDSDAPAIDKAIAASPITKYVPAKQLKPLAGNFDTELPTVFEKQYADYGKSDEDVNEVPGFVNRAENKPIKLRLPGKNSRHQIVVAATIEDAVHETVHLNSKTQFQTNFGHNYNEGVTEYFTELVLGEPGHAYRDEIKLAEGLISALGPGGEDLVGNAFFKGDKGLYLAIIDAFRHSAPADLLSWQKAYVKKPPDWRTANRLLAEALKGSRKSGSATPKGGSSPSQSRPEK
jgi:Domain of unknown function (DUF4157)